MARFTPGKSGNPGGRPKGLGALLRGTYGEDGQKLVAAVEGIAFSTDRKMQAKVRLAALALLLSYGWGKPPQTVTLEDADGKPIGPIKVVIKART